MNAVYVPRDYQVAAIDSVFAELERVRSTLGVLVTGGGKTEIYLQVAEQFLAKNPTKKVMVFAHREELITQPKKRWERNTGSTPCIEMADQRAGEYGQDLVGSLDDRLVISTVQTLNSGKRCRKCTAECGICQGKGKTFIGCYNCQSTGKFSNGEDCPTCDGTGGENQACKPCKGDGWIATEETCDVCFEHFILRVQKFPPMGLVICDECHHICSPSYLRIIRYFRSINPEVRLLGVTATPDRHDEEALGQVFESVAFTYNLPQPIYDGWLVPVEQRFIVIDELNLANCRTTAGDLNGADLEAEMLVEKVLHKVTAPLIEISCGLEEGTLLELVGRNGLGELKDLVTKREPTLVHAASVAHAERMCEIINRYLPNSAVCITGKTDKDARRSWIEMFGRGDYQFMLSCGVFLEGTDLPTVSVVGMARPTKSRSLYTQAAGRGLRPLSGLVDGIETAEERCRLIAESSKPRCILIDFVGNSGRHKLVSALDILGDAFPDEALDEAKRKAVTDGQPVDVLKELQAIRDRMEAEQREKHRRDAAAAKEREDKLKKESAEKRAGIVAGATYATTLVDPFDVFDLMPEREPGYTRGRPPAEWMRKFLAGAKVEISPETTYHQAEQLVKEVKRRREQNLATFAQVKTLKKFGVQGAEDFSFEKAHDCLDAKFNAGEFIDRHLGKVRTAATPAELSATARDLAAAKVLLTKSVLAKLVEAGKARRAELTRTTE